jgi:hypothetical protein
MLKNCKVQSELRRKLRFYWADTATRHTNGHNVPPNYTFILCEERIQVYVGATARFWSWSMALQSLFESILTQAVNLRGL